MRAAGLLLPLLLILLAPVAEASTLEAGKRYVLEPATSVAELLVEPPSANTVYDIRLTTELGQQVAWISVRANSSHVWMEVSAQGQTRVLTLSRATFYSSIVLVWSELGLQKLDFTLQSGASAKSDYVYLNAPARVIVTVYGASLRYTVLRGSVSVTEHQQPGYGAPSLSRCQSLLNPPSSPAGALSYFADAVGCGIEVGYATLTTGVAVLTLSVQLLAYTLPLIPLALLAIITYYALEKPHELPLLVIRLVDLASRLIRFIIELALRIIHILIDLIPF